MPTLRIERRLSLPAQTTASTLYIIKSVNDDLVDLYFTDSYNNELRKILAKQDVIDLISTQEFAAVKLSTPRLIELSGDVTGSVSFDGSKNVDIVTTVVPSEHQHSFNDLSDKPTTLSGYGITDGIKKFSTTIGSDLAVEYIVEHNLNTTAVLVSVFLATNPYSLVYPDVGIIDNDRIKIIFTNPPSVNEFVCTVIG